MKTYIVTADNKVRSATIISRLNSIALVQYRSKNEIVTHALSPDYLFDTKEQAKQAINN